MIEMNFSIPYLNRHPFPDHIGGYESSSRLVGLFKMETGRSNSFYIDVSFSIKAFSSLSAR